MFGWFVVFRYSSVSDTVVAVCDGKCRTHDFPLLLLLQRHQFFRSPSNGKKINTCIFTERDVPVFYVMRNGNASLSFDFRFEPKYLKKTHTGA